MLQRDYQVNVAGPSTMAALLNSLQMGFKTLAIQKRSGEVWQLLGAVKPSSTSLGRDFPRCSSACARPTKSWTTSSGAQPRHQPQAACGADAGREHRFATRWNWTPSRGQTGNGTSAGEREALGVGVDDTTIDLFESRIRCPPASL